MKLVKHLGATAALTLASVILLPLMACSPGSVPDSAAPDGSPAESWRCRNDLEVSCGDGACDAAAEDDFTPMEVHVDDSGALSVCAYTGCWEGSGEVVRSGPFLVVIGHDLEFSTSRDAESAADVVIAIDRSDAVATLKVGAFAQPLLCESLGGAQ